MVASIEKFLSRMLKCNFGLFEPDAGKFPRCEIAAMVLAQTSDFLLR